MVVRVKICGLVRPEDVVCAVEAGADAIGFVREPSSPRFVGDVHQLKELVRLARPFATTVSVFGIFDPNQAGSITDLDQAVEFPGADPHLDRRVVTWRMPAGVHPEAVNHVPGNGPILLDAFVSGAFGGTGHTVDWDTAAQVVKATTRKVILAGGLTPDNVALAVEKVRPYAVDVSSGVEDTPGKKDHGKIREFIQAVRFR